MDNIVKSRNSWLSNRSMELAGNIHPIGDQWYASHFFSVIRFKFRVLQKPQEAPPAPAPAATPPPVDDGPPILARPAWHVVHKPTRRGKAPKALPAPAPAPIPQIEAPKPVLNLPAWAQWRRKLFFYLCDDKLYSCCALAPATSHRLAPSYRQLSKVVAESLYTA